MAVNTKYISGDHTVATQMGGFEEESPLLPFNNEVLIFRAKFRQLTPFVALPFNTPNPDIPGATAYLTNEGPRTPIGPCVDWVREWARIPDMYDMPGGIKFCWFPGLSTADRVAFQLAVPLTIRRTFFLCGNHGAFGQWQDIPVNKALRIFDATDGTLISCIDDQNAELDDTTTPSEADYQALIANGTLIQVEDSKITPWRGSIFVREDYLVPAQ